MTELVLSESFLKKLQLSELFDKGLPFARDKPTFPIHPGAKSVYDPDFDVQIFEGWEALYSLVVSVVIAIFVGGRWFCRRTVRRKEHRFDRYVRLLLDIERRQLTLDDSADADDVESLQKLLDEVTFLRQKALQEFSVHELGEDPGADCFINMCHALSNKVNAKLSRQRLDKRMDELTELLNHNRTRRDGQEVER